MNAARETANEAHSELALHEARLAEDLQMYGPVMTPEEQQKYIDAFWAQPEHAKARADAAAADDAFSKTMAAMRGPLEAAARAGDTDAAKALVAGAETLALSDHHAGEAAQIVLDLGNDQVLFDAVNQAVDGKLEQRLADDVLAQALPRLQAEALATQDEAAFKQTLTSLTKMGAAKNLAGEVKKLEETLAELKADPNAFRIDRLQTAPGKLGLAMKSIAVVSAITTLANGDKTGLQRLQATLQGVKAGYELGTGVLSTFAKAANLTGDAAKFGAKFLPYVGLAIDSVQFAQDIHKLLDGGNAGDWIAAGGTGICLLGDLAGCIPLIGFLPDAGLGALGMVVQGIGGLISNIISGNEKAEKLANERTALLDAAGVSGEARRLIDLLDPTTLKRMGLLGLDRAQAIGLLQSMEGAFATGSEEAAFAFLTAMDVGAGFGLQGEQLLAFIEEFCEAAAKNPEGMYDVTTQVGWLDGDADGVVRDHGSKKSLQDRQRVLLAVLRRFLLPEVIARYGLEQKTTDDINVQYYAAG